MEDHPEFETVMQSIEDRFWDNNKELKQKLSEKGLHHDHARRFPAKILLQ